MSQTLDLFDLHGRRAIVTGGGGFLGRVFAAALLDLGAEVHLVDLDEASLDDAAAVVGAERATDVHAHVCDITDEHAVDDTVGTIAAGGSVDALVNSAAVDPKVEGTQRHTGGHLLGHDAELWRRSLDVNLTGTFLMTRAVARVMTGQGSRGRGSIVNVSSTYGLRGPDQRIYASSDGTPRFHKPVEYSTTKAGILGFTRAVAAQFRETEIRVNALSPGGAYRDHDAAFVSAYSAKTILGRMAEADEYRGEIAFLCSDASSYMTGANLVVDGGWTAF
jgi:NAD(P)-dependent dehydrogenase (short-subunit alcohol dehydrogenase family)